MVLIDITRRLQSVYVPAGDGVRLAVDGWLPTERTAAGGMVGTVLRATRYHRAEGPAEPEPAADTNAAAGDRFNRAGFALVVADVRGTGASFGSRAGELSEREIKDYGELVSWVAAQPWSNGRVGVYGTSYEGQAAELTAGLGNPYLVAMAALFSPYDPYRELYYPGGCATAGRYARWVYESRHGGRSFADTLRPSGAADHDPLSTASQDSRLVAFFARHLERDGEPAGESTLSFGTLGTGTWRAVTRWPPAGSGTQRWYLARTA